MKKNYLKILPVLLLLANPANYLQAQCPVIPAPAITTNTLICDSAGSFVLNATNVPSGVVSWYNSATGGTALATGNTYTTPVLLPGTQTYYASQVTSPVPNQSITLPPHDTSIYAMARGYYFTAPTSLTITGIRVPTDANSGVQSVAIMSLPTAPPLYTGAGGMNNFTTLFLDQLDFASGTNVIPVNIPVTVGTIIGVFGDRKDTTSYYLYNPYSTTLGSYPLTITRLGMLFYLSTTAPQDLWTEPSGTGKIGRVELYTTLGCVSPASSVAVTVSNPPQVSITGPTSPLCSDTAAIPLIANGSSTYTWTNGPNTYTYNVPGNASGSFSVSSANNYGCIGMASIDVTVNPLPTVSITASGTVICAGGSVTLTSQGASTYEWNNGLQQQDLIINTNTTSSYTTTGTDINGCVGSATITIPYSPNPTTTITATRKNICKGEGTTLTASGADTYSWVTGGQTTASIAITPTAQTSYTAIGTNTAGCVKQAVLTVIVSACTGIEENTAAENSIHVFPNPSNGQITIQSDEAIRQVVLKDISGRVILNQEFNSLTSLSLNLENLNAGVYFIELPQNRMNKNIKVVKE